MAAPLPPPMMPPMIAPAPAPMPILVASFFLVVAAVRADRPVLNRRTVRRSADERVKRHARCAPGPSPCRRARRSITGAGRVSLPRRQSRQAVHLNRCAQASAHRSSTVLVSDATGVSRRTRSIVPAGMVTSRHSGAAAAAADDGRPRAADVRRLWRSDRADDRSGALRGLHRELVGFASTSFPVTVAPSSCLTLTSVAGSQRINLGLLAQAAVATSHRGQNAGMAHVDLSGSW